MLDNHHICDFTVFNTSFEPFNYLGHRDKQVIRQCLQNFSTAIALARSDKKVPKILETGAGLSTVIFSKLLTYPDESIKTIDAFSNEAIKINSRGASDHFRMSDLHNCEVIQGVTIDEKELTDFYQSPHSTLISLPPKDMLAHLDMFLNFNMDDRKNQKIATLLNLPYFNAEVLKRYFMENSLFENELIRSFKTSEDEFHFLKNNTAKPKLRELLQNYQPNIIYLDSGEYSTNIEFNIIDAFSEKGTILIVQDIFFPKSIKSFFIASAIMSSDRWRTLWIDKTTPQGMIVCKKES